MGVDVRGTVGGGGLLERGGSSASPPPPAQCTTPSMAHNCPTWPTAPPQLQQQLPLRHSGLTIDWQSPPAARCSPSHLVLHWHCTEGPHILGHGQVLPTWSRHDPTVRGAGPGVHSPYVWCQSGTRQPGLCCAPRGFCQSLAGPECPNGRCCSGGGGGEGLGCAGGL